MMKNNPVLIAVLLFTLPIAVLSIITEDKQIKSQELGFSKYFSFFSVQPVSPTVGENNPIMGVTLCRSTEMTYQKDWIAGNAVTAKKRAKRFKEKTYPESGPAQEKATTILIEVVPELMKFDLDTFTVTAGEKIILELDNLDGMQHNLLIIKPGTLDKVGNAADAMLRDPKASEKHYVPDMPEVLFATDMLDPDEVFTLNFTAPEQPGDYPFVCTFPGHWRMMNGIMRVVKS